MRFEKPSSEYLSKMTTAAAEAEKNKQQEAAEAQKQKEAQDLAEREHLIQEALTERESAIGEARQKQEEGQSLGSDLSNANKEAQQFDELAPKIKELGIDDGEFTTKHEEAKNRPIDIEQKISDVAGQEMSASEKVEEIESNPEIVNRLHEEALKENEARDLEKSLEHKQKELEERLASVDKMNQEIGQLDVEIGGFDGSLRQIELGLDWLKQSEYFDDATTSLRREVSEKLQQSEKQKQEVVARLQNLPKKLFGLREDKIGQETLEQENATIETNVNNLKYLQESFNRYSADNDIGRLTDEQFNQILQQEVGQSSPYDYYKHQRDTLNKIAGELGRYGSGKLENDLTTEQQQAQKAKQEKQSRKNILVKHIDHVTNTVIPQLEQEIGVLQGSVAK